MQGYFPKLTDEVAPQTRPTTELGRKVFGHLRRLPNFVRDPSMGGIEALLAQSPEVLGIENERGGVLLFVPEEADYANAAAAMGMPDPANPDFPGITLAIRTDDWRTRERRRADPDSFTSKCRNATSGPAR